MPFFLTVLYILLSIEHQVEEVLPWIKLFTQCRFHIVGGGLLDCFIKPHQALQWLIVLYFLCFGLGFSYRMRVVACFFFFFLSTCEWSLSAAKPLWLADSVALALTCWALMNNWLNKMKGCRKRSRASRGNHPAYWLDALSTQRRLPSSCFLTLLTTASLQTRCSLFAHPRRLDMTGLCIGVDLQKLAWFFDCWKPMWSFSFWSKCCGAVESGFSAVSPSLLNLLDLRGATICGRPWETAASHRPRVFLVATMCTQGWRMLWLFYCVAALWAPVVAFLIYQLYETNCLFL